MTLLIYISKTVVFLFVLLLFCIFFKSAVIDCFCYCFCTVTFLNLFCGIKMQMRYTLIAQRSKGVKCLIRIDKALSIFISKCSFCFCPLFAFCHFEEALNWILSVVWSNDTDFNIVCLYYCDVIRTGSFDWFSWKYFVLKLNNFIVFFFFFWSLCRAH